MTKIKFESGPTIDRDLERVVEPLASFICATERPRAALASALGLLASEVEQTNMRRKRTLRDPFGEPLVMKYLLLIYMDELHAMDENERADCYAESTQLAQELHANGQYLGCNPLHPTATATSVRVRDGNPLVTDGPFAETREQLGGYFLIEAKDLDAGDRHRRTASRRTPRNRRDPAGHGNVRPTVGMTSAACCRGVRIRN